MKYESKWPASIFNLENLFFTNFQEKISTNWRLSVISAYKYGSILSTNWRLSVINSYKYGSILLKVVL